MLQLPRSASSQQQAAELPKYEHGHKESVVILGHAIPNDLQHSIQGLKKHKKTIFLLSLKDILSRLQADNLPPLLLQGLARGILTAQW